MKRYFIIAIIVVLIAAVYLVAISMFTYTGYSVNGSYELTTETQTQFEYFQNNVLRYNKDGAFYSDSENNLLWSVTYEMKSPQFKSCGYYGLLYDKNGTTVNLVKAVGSESAFYTSLPITLADVSSNGYVAVIMQDEDVAYLKLYQSDGSEILSGEFYSSNYGFPIAMALSSDGTRLAISQLNVTEGKTASVVTFYDFSNKNSTESEAQIAAYTYEDVIIPELDYVSGDKLLAFGDSRIIVYGNQSEPKAITEVQLDHTVSSVMHSDDYFATIYEDEDENGMPVEKLAAYNLSGRQRFDREITSTYTACYFIDSDEMAITDSTHAEIYTIYGVNRFNGDIEGGINKILPQEGTQRYLFITKNAMEQVSLR